MVKIRWYIKSCSVPYSMYHNADSTDPWYTTLLALSNHYKVNNWKFWSVFKQTLLNIDGKQGLLNILFHIWCSKNVSKSNNKSLFKVSSPIMMYGTSYWIKVIKRLKYFDNFFEKSVLLINIEAHVDLLNKLILNN